jgi:hypothetical protein
MLARWRAAPVSRPALGREASMPARGRAAPASSRASPASRSTASRSMPSACRTPRRAVPLRRTDAGGAIGREALDAATGASGDRIKPGEPARRSTARREPLDAVPCHWSEPMPVVRSEARPSMPAWGRAARRDQARRARRGAPLDAGDAPRPSTCRAAAPGPMPVARSAPWPACSPRSRASRRPAPRRGCRPARQGLQRIMVAADTAKPSYRQSVVRRPLTAVLAGEPASRRHRTNVEALAFAGAVPGPAVASRCGRGHGLPRPWPAFSALAGEPPATTTARMPASANVKDQFGGSATAAAAAFEKCCRRRGHGLSAVYDPLRTSPC